MKKSISAIIILIILAFTALSWADTQTPVTYSTQKFRQRTTTPSTPGTGICSWYFKSDGMPYYICAGGSETRANSGVVTVVTDSATGNVTAAQMQGQTHVVTGAYTLSLPTAAVGYKAKFLASTAAVFSIDVVTGTDVIVLNGTALTAGNKATTDGTINAEVYVECRIAGKYHIISIVGLVVDGGA